MAALDSEQDKARENAQTEVGVLKERLASAETKLAKLLDVYLADALSTEEYAAKKQSLLSQKMSLSEKITDFETKGLSWLEPAREFVKSLNQATNLLSSQNKSEMPTFLKNIGSNHILRNRQFVFAPKIEYQLVAERGEANLSNLQFPFWCIYTTKLEIILAKIAELCIPRALRATTRGVVLLQSRSAGNKHPKTDGARQSKAILREERIFFAPTDFSKRRDSDFRRAGWCGRNARRIFQERLKMLKYKYVSNRPVTD